LKIEEGKARRERSSRIKGGGGGLKKKKKKKKMGDHGGTAGPGELQAPMYPKREKYNGGGEFYRGKLLKVCKQPKRKFTVRRGCLFCWK
jgi:hypothetical protein